MDNIRVAVLLLVSWLATGLASNIGDSCTSDSSCSSSGQYCQIYSNCDGKGSCNCKTGYTTVGTGCQLTKLIGDSCDSNMKCPDGSTCSTSSTCTCNTNTRASANKKYCVPSASKIIGEACTSSDTCVEAPYYEGSSNANCQNGYCVCINGRKVSEQQCLLYDYGETCTTTGTKNCNINKAYACTSSKCQCMTDHVYFSPKAECVYTSATRNVGEGGACNEDGNTSTAKWCASGLTCTTCPAGGSKLCRKANANSAKTLSISIAVVLVATARIFM